MNRRDFLNVLVGLGCAAAAAVLPGMPEENECSELVAGFSELEVGEPLEKKPMQWVADAAEWPEAISTQG